MHKELKLQPAAVSEPRCIGDDASNASSSCQRASARDVRARAWSNLDLDRSALGSGGSGGDARSHRAIRRLNSLKGSARSSPSASSRGSSWGSSIQSSAHAGALRTRARHGEELLFAPLARGSTATSLAGLHIFIMERFGGPEIAFKTMDFHRDGRVSCLEFQEVVSGQERYCGLQEARELFCVLARGTDGSLTLEDFLRSLGWDTPAIGAEDAEAVLRSAGDGESAESLNSPGPSPSCCESSDTTGSVRLAGNALRSLVLGRAGLGISMSQDATNPPEAEADDLATTVQTLTSRSSQSCAALPGRAHAAPQRPIFPGAGSSVPSRSSSSMLPGHMQMEVADAAEAEAALVPPPSGSLRDALQGGSEEMKRWLLGGLHGGKSHAASNNEAGMAAALGSGFQASQTDPRQGFDGRPAETFAVPATAGATPTPAEGLKTLMPLVRMVSSPSRAGSHSEAMRQLDESLFAWRYEVAALQNMASTSTVTSRLPAGASCGALPSSATLPRPGMITEAVERHAVSSVSGPAAPPPASLLSTGVPCLPSQQDVPEVSLQGAQSLDMSIAATVAPGKCRRADAAGGLAWLAALPHAAQGRLAACRCPADALEILDEVIASLPASSNSGACHRTILLGTAGFTSSEEVEIDAGAAGPRRRRGAASRSRGKSSAPLAAPRGRRREQPTETAELVAASAELLKSAQARVVGLEQAFQERQRRHELEVSELRRHQHRSRKKSLHQLLDRLPPQHGALSAQRQGCPGDSINATTTSCRGLATGAGLALACT